MRNSIVAILLSALLLLVSACGGGGGGNENPPQADTVSGVAAAGLVIVGNVSLKDASATPRELSKATTDGRFSFDVTGLTKPFLLRVTGEANGTPYTLYSLAGDKGTANINPLTNLVVANAAGGADLAAIYAAPAPGAFQGVADRLPQALLDVKATLRPILQKYNLLAVDPIKDLYQANGTGLDHMLDLVRIELAAGSVTITDSGSSPVAPITRDVATGFATHAVSGSVTLEGAGFAGVTVSVRDQATGAVSYGSATTLADGSYLIGNVPQGSYTVTPAKAGYSFDRANSAVTVAAADCPVPPFHSFNPNTVSGKVASANGQGLAGVTISAQRAGVAGILTDVTDGSGSYAISGLGNGDYTISASRSDVFNAQAVSFDAASKAFTIGAARNYAFVDFTADLASFSVSGNVARLTGGAPMAQVTLTLVTKNNSGALLTNSDAIFTAVTDAAGNYSLNGIPSGYYALTPTLTGYGFALLDSIGNHGMTADNFRINGANQILDFTGRPDSDANGGVGGI